MGERTREYIYGINPVFEVVRSGRRKVYEAYIYKAGDTNPRLRKLIEFLEKNSVPIIPEDKGRIMQLSGSKEHQGVVLRVQPYPYVASETLWGRDALLMLDNVEDPHNVGAILRSAEIFGFSSVLIPIRGVPDIYPSIVKVSAGATEFMEIAKDSSANQYCKVAIDLGYEVVALDGAGPIEIREMAAKKIDKLLLVIGGEDKSVGQFILNAAQYVVRVGQKGKISSLNASVAAGIALFSLARPR